MTYLNLASNCLGPKGAKRVAKAIKNNGALTGLDISNNRLTRVKDSYDSSKGETYASMFSMDGVIALADAIGKSQ